MIRPERNARDGDGTVHPVMRRGREMSMTSSMVHFKTEEKERGSIHVRLHLQLQLQHGSWGRHHVRGNWENRDAVCVENFQNSFATRILHPRRDLEARYDLISSCTRRPTTGALNLLNSRRRLKFLTHARENISAEAKIYLFEPSRLL